MDLETAIGSEVSQKEKNKYISTHTCEIQKNDTDDLICKTDPDAEDKCMDTKEGRGVR